MSTASKQRLTAVVAVFIVCNLAFLSFDTVPPGHDEAVHMTVAFQFRDVLVAALHNSHLSIGWIRGLLRRLVSIDTWVYPPLFPLLAGWFLPGACSSVQCMSLMNIPFVLLLAATTLGIARRIHQQSAGLAMTLLLCYPVVFAQSRHFMLDFAALAWTSASVYLLLRSDGFADPRFSLLFGASVGVGALMKQTVVTALIPVTCYVSGAVLWRSRMGQPTLRELGRRGLVGMAALALGTTIAASWYLPRYGSIMPATLSVAGMDNSAVARWERLSWPVRSLALDQIGFVFTAIFLCFLPTAWRVVEREKRGLLFAWILGIYAIAVAIPHKTERQYLSLLVPVSVVSAIGLCGEGRLRRFSALAVFAYAGVQLVALSIPGPLLANTLTGLGWTAPAGHVPQREDWKIEQLLLGLPQAPATIAVIADHEYINGQVLQYYALKLHLPLRAVKCRDEADTFLRDPLAYDYFVTKSDWISTEGLRGNPYVAPNVDLMIARAFEAQKERLLLLGRYAMPDKSEMLLYKREDSLR
jgi:hypothetical protein